MIIAAVVLAVVLAGLLVWWRAELRRGPATETPDDAVRSAQDPRQPHSNATEDVGDAPSSTTD